MSKGVEKLSGEKPEIFVRNSGVVTLQEVNDYPDGVLFIGESGGEIDFLMKRFYLIDDLHRRDAIRGKHVHRELQQIIFCLRGSFDLHLDDGETKQTVVMDSPRKGVYLGSWLWHEMDNFSPDCLVLVVASDRYNEEDYIRNYDDFLKGR